MAVWKISACTYIFNSQNQYFIMMKVFLFQTVPQTGGSAVSVMTLMCETRMMSEFLLNDIIAVPHVSSEILKL